MDLLKIGLLSDKVDAYTLRDTADWIIKPRLLAVPGVAHVIVFGGDVRQIQVQPDMHKLASYDITLADVARMPRARLCRCAAPVSSISPAQRILLESPTPQPDIDALGQAVVAVRNGTPILLRDVAQVNMAPALRSGDALIMGKPGVLLSLASQYGANTLTATLAVEKALADLRAGADGAGNRRFIAALHRPGQLHRAGARQICKNPSLIAAVSSFSRCCTCFCAICARR